MEDLLAGGVCFEYTSFMKKPHNNVQADMTTMKSRQIQDLRDC